jgi:outer membrane protein TolC
VQAQSEAGKAIDTSGRRLRAAEEAYRVRTLLFQNGRATGVELTDAEVELTRARLDAVAARVGLHVARVELAHAAGLDVEE